LALKDVSSSFLGQVFELFWGIDLEHQVGCQGDPSAEQKSAESNQRPMKSEADSV
jgi:hypothetical protein